MKPYACYLFDIDRTLWDFDRNAAAALTRMLEGSPALLRRAGTAEAFIRTYEACNHRLWEDYESGKIGKEELRWRRFFEAWEAFGLRDESLAREWGGRYLEEMVQGTLLMPYAREVLDFLSAAGARIGAVTNGFAEVQRRKLERSGILDRFHTIVISEEVGCLKPAPAIFRIALERIGGVNPEDTDGWKALKRQTLMVGDDPRNDIEGAQIFGLDQFLVRKNAASSGTGATYEADDLSPLLERDGYSSSTR